MWDRRVAGVSHLGDLLARLHGVSHLDLNAASLKVGVHRELAVTVINHHSVARFGNSRRRFAHRVVFVLVLGQNDGAPGGGDYRLAEPVEHIEGSAAAFVHTTVAEGDDVISETLVGGDRVVVVIDSTTALVDRPLTDKRKVVRVLVLVVEELR